MKRLTQEQIGWALAIIKKLNEDAEYKPTKTHKELLKRYKLENPRNYPAFYDENVGIIYAVNQASADAQAAKILRKKQRANAV